MDTPWIQVSPRSPFFITESGEPWTPIGQNDAIEWPDLAGFFRRKDIPGARHYLATLKESGVSVLRLMLEYCHHEHRYFERPVGTFPPSMLQLWDDLFGACEEFGLRVLLTPFDTFWMWRRWRRHPYNAALGGPCSDHRGFFLCEKTREAVKRRLEFATRRWGASGVIFAWDLWNGLHTAYGRDAVEHAHKFVTDISSHLRAVETGLFGRAHLQTVSVFLPLLQQKPDLAEVIYRHPQLDFATTHFYEEGTIDHPNDTIAPAISTGRLVHEALAEMPPQRPFFDSEHGPIHTFKDHHRVLPEPFDDEYFRHIQWAHFASGGAGGAMRWPNRRPHTLTAGMRRAQKALAQFLPHIDWVNFQRQNWNKQVQVLGRVPVVVFASGDRNQAVLWLLRKAPLDSRGMVDRSAAPLDVEIALPGQLHTPSTVVAWDTTSGQTVPDSVLVRRTGDLTVICVQGLVADRAIALRA